ncbi:MAG TPA: hypothetical protein DCE78_12160 [Bacteroidetes bacterium]|nr:hypothetical protein [Bacteroidota bacterium]
MVKRTKFLLSLICSVIFLTAATTTYQLEFKVEEGLNLNEIVAKWNVSSLDGIKEFELERKMNSSSWVLIHKVTENIIASGKKEYEFIDNDVYKNGETQAVAEYRLRVRHSDNTTAEFTSQVSYSTSAVRRTWGSIKSMFQ